MGIADAIAVLMELASQLPGDAADVINQIIEMLSGLL